MVNNPNFILYFLSSLTCKACGTSSLPGLCAYNYDIAVGVPFYAHDVNWGMIFFYMGRRLCIQMVPAADEARKVAAEAYPIVKTKMSEN
jgi:hypothetical protein